VFRVYGANDSEYSRCDASFEFLTLKDISRTSIVVSAAGYNQCLADIGDALLRRQE
jgi:hypothetical protein